MKIAVVKVFEIFLFALTAIPVLLLPFVTSVPVAGWAALLGLDVFLVVLWRRCGKSKQPVRRVFTGFLAVFALAVAASQGFAATPPIIRENSIAALEKVRLGETDQWITIRGKDKSKPVLLYLGIGGPGAGGFPATQMNLKPLEDHFVVVNWDQPGTGKSYNAVEIKTLTVQKFIDDAHQLTVLLKERFQQEKIYVLGLSWGTILGTKLVSQYPEDYHAYIGTGQMVNTTQNDRFGYRLAIQIAEEKNDRKLRDRLFSYGEPPYTGDGMALKYADYNNVLFDWMGSANLQTVLLLAPQFAREYGYIDKVNFARGLVESFPVVYSQLQDLDFITQAGSMQIPMYFIVGRYDVNAVASMVEEYYKVLKAPHKELIWVESGHGASAGDILNTMVNHVLAYQSSQSR